MRLSLTLELLLLLLILVSCSSENRRSIGHTLSSASSFNVEKSAQFLPGSINYQTSVDNLGQLSASVDLHTLPAGNGFVPKISLTYYSGRESDTNLGYGWQLTGLSSFERCSRTKIYDGFNQAPFLSDSDAICYDGRRLLLVAGKNLTDGAEYRLFQDDYSKIVYRAENGLEAAYFQVWKKSGDVQIFGLHASSRRMTSEKKILSWFLESVTDRKGNEISYVYNQSQEHASPQLESIKYGGNTVFGVEHYRSVHFIYEAAVTPSKKFLVGQPIVESQRIKIIELKSNETVKWNYQFKYKALIGSTGQALESLTKCFQAKCFKPTTLEYQTEAGLVDSGTSERVYLDTDSDLSTLSQRYFIDINNDGRDDLLTLYFRKGTVSIQYGQENGTLGEAVTADVGLPKTWSIRADVSFLYDFNRDGFIDLLTTVSDGSSTVPTEALGLYLLPGSKNGFTAPVHLLKDFDFGSNRSKNYITVADGDHDGYPDLFIFKNEGLKVLKNEEGQSFKDLGLVSTAFTAEKGWNFSEHPRYMQDVNGDGIIDVVGFGRNGIEVSLGKGNFIFSETTLWTKEFGSQSSLAFGMKNHKRMLVDMNADGLVDVVGMHEDGTWVALNTGTGFSQSDLWLADLGVNQRWNELNTNRYIFDVNGDGFADFIGVSASRFYVYLGKGAPFSGADDSKKNLISLNVPEMVTWNKARQPITFGDINNDGMTEFFVSQTGRGLLKISNTSKKTRLTAIEDGLGNRSEARYDSSITKNLYSKTKDYDFPLMTLPSSGLLVSELRQSDGQGGFNAISYRYENALMHLDGLGFLGFERWESFDKSTQIKTLNSYSTDYKGLLTSLPIDTKTFIVREGRDNLLSHVSSTWESVALGSSTMHRANNLRKILAQKYDLEGNLISSSETSQEYGQYGNIVISGVETKDSFGKEKVTIKNEFDADRPNNWILGRLSSSEVIYEKDGQPSITKKSAFHYDTDGLLIDEIIEPGTSFEIKTIYGRSRNKFGLVDSYVKTWNESQGRGLAFKELSETKSFDAKGFSESHTNSIGQTSTVLKRNDEDGAVLEEQDPNGFVTRFSYDEEGRPSSVLKYDGTTSSSKVDWCDTNCPPNATVFLLSKAEGAGWSKTFLSMQSKVVRKEYPGFNGKILAEDSEYYSNGLLKRQSLPYVIGTPVLWTNYSYDELLRLNSVNYADGTTESKVYSKNTSTTIDALGRKTQSLVDSSGRLQSVTNAKDEVIAYDYDATGKLITVKDSKNNRTKLSYDVLGHRISIDDPNSGITITSFNALDLPYLTKDSLGQTTSMEYDALGRLIKKNSKVTSGEESLASWTYDEELKGSLTSVKGQDYEEHYRYDNLGRPSQVEKVIFGKKVLQSFSYDQYSRPILEVYPSGLSVKRNYDGIGNLSSLSDTRSGRLYWEALDTSNSGQLSDYRNGNGVKAHTEFDGPTGLITSLTYVKDGATIIDGRSFSYSLDHNLETRKNLINGIQENFAYDELSRIKSVSEAGRANTDINYDELGNILFRSDKGSYSYGETCDGQKAGPSAVTKVGNEIYCYNGKGQMTRGSDKKISYGPNNLPVLIQTQKGSTSFEYAPGGERILQISTGSGGKIKTTYVSSDYEEIEDANGLSQKHYIGNNLILTIKGGVEEEAYLNHDHLGSVISITGKTGEIEERFDYDAWGMRRDVESRSLLSDYHPKVSNYGYTGQEHLDNLSLIHMNGRVYDPTIGRFLSADTYVQDPTNLQSLNRYSYVWNNPLNATDPSGFFSLSINSALNSFGRAMYGVMQGVSNPAKSITSAGNHLSKWTKSPSNQRLVVSIAIAVAAAYTGGAAACAFEGWQGWAAGAAISGAGGYASGYVASDGNQEYARKSALSGMAFFTVGQYIQASDSTMKVVKVGAHGVVGGVAARNSGGTFESGFLSAAVSEGLTQSGAYDSVADGIDVSRGNIVYGAVASSLVGGTTSELSGGTFENGATTASFGRLFNEAMHSVETRSGVSSLATYDVQNIEICDKDGFEGTLQSKMLLARTAFSESGIESDYTIENIFAVGSVAKVGLSYALANSSSELISVTRWGRSGLEAGDWVMTGGKTPYNYLMSGKFQPSWMPGNNLPAAFQTGETFIVPRNVLSMPNESSAANYIKYVLGQRIYKP